MKVEFYEGYIRNQKKLCEELGLMPAGSREETERTIIQEAYRRWGHDLCTHLYGAFSFAIRDEKSGELFCARDQLGLKPFFYYLAEDGTLLVGTTPAKIAREKRYRPHIDLEALQIYMMFGYPAGEKTLFQGIQKLPPGTYLLTNRGKVKICEYDRLEFHPDDSRSEEEWIRDLETTLGGIIQEDRENFPFEEAGAFLSGGVDSSYLLALSGVHRTYGIGYEETPYSETALARETAARMGAGFSEIRITPEEFFKEFPQVIRNLGLPVVDRAAAVFAMGCKRLAGQRKSSSSCGLQPGMSGPMLSGEGADEFLAGYHVYRRADTLGWTDGPRHFGCSGVMDAEPAGQLLMLDRIFPYDSLVEELYRRTENAEHLSRLLLIDIRCWFEGDILYCVDRAACSNGLDLLLPYADRRFFELTSRIPSSLKLKGDTGKYILRRAAERRLPHETAFRGKVGFSVPLKVWLRQENVRRETEELLFGPRSRQFFDQRLLQDYWQSFLAGNGSLWKIVFSAYAFLIWENNVYSTKGGDHE